MNQTIIKKSVEEWKDPRVFSISSLRKGPKRPFFIFPCLFIFSGLFIFPGRFSVRNPGSIGRGLVA